MKNYTVEIINIETKEVVESHKTNDFKKCIKRIKTTDDSGALYQKYFHCQYKVTDNVKNRVLDDSEIWSLGN